MQKNHKYKDIGDRLKILRGKEKTQEKFASEHHTTLRTYQYYESGERKPDLNFVKEVAAKYGKSIDWIFTGQETHKKNETEFVNIPQYSDRISAGGGLVPINNIDIRVAFRRDWILRKGNPDKMSLIIVSGDSMYPTLMSGDLVLINHGQNHLDPQGGIYAIALDEVILIKRLQILYPSGKVRVSSDNTQYAALDLSPEEININGRVIWFGREM